MIVSTVQNKKHTKRDEEFSWYLVHTKPREEWRALENLINQEYICFLPYLLTTKLRKNTKQRIREPLFPRYLFIQLSVQAKTQSWAPIRSTKGVHRLVKFGDSPAKAPNELIEALKYYAQQYTEEVATFQQGDKVRILSGPFAGIEAIYHIDDSQQRAFVLIEIMHNPTKVRIAKNQLWKKDE